MDTNQSKGKDLVRDRDLCVVAFVWSFVFVALTGEDGYLV